MTSWQRLLSSRPTKRTDVASELTINGEAGAILYEFPGRDEETGELKIKETHSWSYEKVRKGLSGPPLHIHLRQTERFKVLKGKLGIIHNEQEIILTPESEAIVVHPGARHRFFPHPTSGEDVVFTFWMDPETNTEIDAGLDENFIRNFASYLMDCEREGIPPSIFQLLVILWNAEVILTPPFYVPIMVLKILHYVLAHLVGEVLLGYKPTYKEYTRTTSPVEATKAF